MKHTFYLKEPKSKKESLILFSCYFKEEVKKFVYSTGEKIKPFEWNFEENRPKLKGKFKNIYASTIQTQLGRYSKVFKSIESLCKITNESFTAQLLREEFNKEFKKVPTSKNLFFDAYDTFMIEKQKRKEWKPSTVKRYTNIKNHLLTFEAKRNYKLTFSRINDSFYTEFLDYCYNDLDHYSNTVSRNIGLFKTFMYWALKERYTYNESFKEFVTPKTVITEEIALNLKEVEEIFNIECESKKLERVKDIFVFQCLTGLRYGEMKAINKRVITENAILLKEEKDSSKEYREIPLFKISNYILKKYDYKLPLISNQKQNKYIKEILKKAGYNRITEYTKVKGVESTKFIEPLYDRIKTHTARRAYISIMRNKGIADKTIMSITGHKDLKTFNMYHKVNNEARLSAVIKAFGTMELPKLKKVD
jgi:site-specific recombinase XerD